MMTAARKRLLEALIRACTPLSGSATPHGQVQPVSSYSTSDGQKSYVESYLPKQIGCWRYVRSKLGAKPIFAKTVSIGAGPRLCLWGWFFDYPPTSHEIVAVDVLDWGHVTNMPEFLRAEIDILGRRPTIVSGHFPEDFIAPQCTQVLNLAPFRTSSIKEASWVIFPFLFGHLLDRDGKINKGQMGQLGQRIRDLVAAGNVAIIVDKAGGSPGTDWFWSDLVIETLGYKMTTPTPVFDFNAYSAEFAACYSDLGVGEYRTGTRTTRASGFWLDREHPEPNWILN